MTDVKRRKRGRRQEDDSRDWSLEYLTVSRRIRILITLLPTEPPLGRLPLFASRQGLVTDESSSIFISDDGQDWME